MSRVIVLDRVPDGVRAVAPDAPSRVLAPGELAGYVADVEAAHRPGGSSEGEPVEPDGVRWVWDSTAAWYPQLLRDGVRVDRCWDLRLVRRILAGSTLVPPQAHQSAAPQTETPQTETHQTETHQTETHQTESHPQASPSSARDERDERDEWDEWDGDWGGEHRDEASEEPDALFAVVPERETRPPAPRDALAEYERQQRVLSEVADTAPHGQRDAHRLRLLVAAECSGALAAVELRHDGLPFRADLHDQTLTALLGPRPPAGERPRELERLAVEIREHLGAPTLNPDSPPHLLRELRRNGLDVTSTNQWEIARATHDVVAPLLAYRKLARLASANGWTWLEDWVSGGRFRSEYVPAGVVTGRWSSRGGGALSLPKVIRGAVRADEGWRLVVVDAAQLEPRMLAAMSGDSAMLAAGARGDLYQGLVDDGVVDTRAHAKVGMLAVLYGSTTGQSALLLPRIARAYPRAMALVDAAARTGESGGVVTTWLGRSSPPPSREWREVQQSATAPGADAGVESRARSRARDWGRFTRNFVVQGTAAEWATAWIAGVRLGLRSLPHAGDGAPRLAFFLHDELVVHTPYEMVDGVARVLLDAADAASRLLFPHVATSASAPLVPLDLCVVDAYSEADERPAADGSTTSGEAATEPAPAP